MLYCNAFNEESEKAPALVDDGPAGTARVSPHERATDRPNVIALIAIVRRAAEVLSH